MIRRLRLHLTRLEDRCTPATWGNLWPDAAHLTLSFAPDGTSVGGTPSSLSQLLGRFGTGWQLEALRAFQTWAVNANINLSLQADGGQPFGADGAPQGDARFGDVRLAAVPMSRDVTALAAPFDATAGTWAGDVQLNSNDTFSLGGSSTGYDLYSVLLHEAGHVFGFDHGDDQTSVMYEGYQGVRTGLSAEDIARLHALYGARAPDANEGAAGNDTFATATRLSLLSLGNGTLAQTVAGDITTHQDRDVFSVSTLLSVGGLDVQLHVSDLSLLTARVTVYDAAGRVVGSAAAADPRSGNLDVLISNARPLSTYFIAVEGARGDVFGIGSYSLQVAQFPPVSSLLGGLTDLVGTLTAPAVQLLANNDLHTNDTFLTATLLPPLTSQADSRFDYGYRGSISDSSDRDLYRVVAPANSTVLTAMAWGTPTPGLLSGDQHLDPQIRVYDAQGRHVAAELLINDGYAYTVQVAGVQPGAVYFIEVQADGSRPGATLGNYFLGIDFNATPAALRDVAAGALGQDGTSAQGVLTPQQSQLMHFVLAAGSTGGAAVVMTVTDAQGRVVLTLRADPREPVSGNVYLKAGRYTVRFTAAGGPVSFRLRGNGLSDPIGPGPSDPTANPSGGSGGTGDAGDEWSYGWSGGGPDNSNVPPSSQGSDPVTTV